MSDQQLLSQGPPTVGAHGPLTQDELDKAKQQLEDLKQKFGFIEPERSAMDAVSPDLWRFGTKPNYTLANLYYFKGKYKNHKPGSLELVVENLVKTWEFESSHKKDVGAWTTIDQTDAFEGFAANGWKRYTKQEMIEAGNYNLLMHGVDKSIWDSEKTDWHESHEVFRKAMPAFAWEVMEVFSGPPTVAFSWHHFGQFTGEYKGNKGNGEWINMFGFAVVDVNDKLQIKKVDIYYDPVTFLESLEGKKPVNAGNKFSGCPFIEANKSKMFGMC